MQISVVNLDPAISTTEMLRVIRAVNVQIERDFEPYWHMGARLRLDSHDPKKKLDQLSGLRGDAIMYVMSKPDEELAGYHEKHHTGVPFGYVFTALSDALAEPWSIAFSHEVLELLADPECNLLCKGPHPDSAEHRRHVFHWLEVCDAVQSEHYDIDGVKVANFVLPQYFTGGEELDGRNDFLATKTDGKMLRSFSVNPGGYVGFYDPERKDNFTYEPSEEAQRRSAAKAKIVHRSFRRADRREQEVPLRCGGEKAKDAGKSKPRAKSMVPRQTGRKQVARKRKV